MLTNKPPLISIVVPTYNNDKYINDCIESVVQQSYPNIELLIIDDGSSDKTIETIQLWQNQHHNIYMYRHAHSGVSASRNLGIAKAKGEYIFFIDADDTIQNNCIQTLFDIANTTSSDITVIKRPNKFTAHSNSPKHTNNPQRTTVPGLDAALEMLQYNIVISSWGKLFNLKLLKNNSINFNESLSYGEGFDFTIRAMLASKKVTITNQPLYNYRVDSYTSIMSRYKTQMVNDSYRALNSIKEALYKKTLSYQHINIINYAFFHTSYDLLNTVYAVKVKDKLAIQHIKTILRANSHNILGLKLSHKEKVKIISYRIFPKLTAQTINHFRKRKFINE